MVCGCKSKEERKEKVKAMTHEERIEYANKMKYAGMGMVVGGIGSMGGMIGGLWGAIGAGAIGAGFGSSAGLIFGSCGPFSCAKETLCWDKEFEGGDFEDNKA